MIAAGASTSFGMLLVSRLVLGAVTATSGPTLASLIGDFFPSRERGKVYGFILTGDLLGSVIGLFVSGNAAAISWRLAFWVLVIPSAILAWAIWRFLPEPDRGGSSRLASEDAEPAAAQPAVGGSPGAATSDPAEISGGSAPRAGAGGEAGRRPSATPEPGQSRGRPDDAVGGDALRAQRSHQRRADHRLLAGVLLHLRGPDLRRHLRAPPVRGRAVGGHHAARRAGDRGRGRRSGVGTAGRRAVASRTRLWPGARRRRPAAPAGRIDSQGGR